MGWVIGDVFGLVGKMLGVGCKYYIVFDMCKVFF